MTPFGAKVRALRRERGITMKRMAGDLDISQAFLSALEHGHRGRPSPALLVQICEYFHLIWDDYEEMHRLARLSHPRVVVDTRGLDPVRTELANLLADKIDGLSDLDAANLLERLKNAQPVAKRPRTSSV